MAKEKDTLPVEKKEPKKKKNISEKKADKNEIRALMNTQKAEMKIKTIEMKNLRLSLKGKTKDEQKEIKTHISILSKEINELEKVQSIELKKKKKEVKHKYKIASKAKKEELKQLKRIHKEEIAAHKKKIKALTLSMKGKSKDEQKELKKAIKLENKELKATEKKFKTAVKAIKRELKKLKEKMKKPKARVRILPLIIVIIIFTGCWIFITFFLDGFLKNAIEDTVESTYGAKCDIENLDLAIIDSYFLVEDFTLANKDRPMKNLFEFSRMIIDFDLTQLFLARFVSDELSIEGVCIGTDRTVSGELPKAQREAIERKKKEKAEKQANSEFHQAMNAVTSDLGDNSQNFIQETIEKFTLDNILNSYLEQLTLPGLVEESKTTVEETVEYWKTTIPQLETDGTELTKEMEELVEIYSSSNASPQDIKNGIEKTTKVLNESKEMYAQIDELFDNIEKDSETMKTLSKDIKNAVSADTNFVTTELDNIISFDFSDSEGLVSSMIEDYIVAALGEYYPTVMKGLNYLTEAKTRFSNVAKTEEKKEGFKRLKGQTIIFNEQMPTFLVKKMNFSGSDASDWLTVNGFINDITHQPEIIGRPITTNIDLSISQYDVEVDGLIDIRDETTHEMVELAFVGDGIDTDFLKNPTTVGVPAVDGKMGIDGNLDIGKDGDFLLDSKLIFAPVELSADQFDPPEVYDIYKDILATISEFYLDAKVGFSFTDGVTIELATDADKKIFDGLEVALNKIIEDLKVSIQNDITDYLEGYTKQFTSEFEQFDSYKNDFTSLKDNFSKAQEDLKNSANSYQDKMKTEAEDKIKDTAKDALGGLFKGF